MANADYNRAWMTTSTTGTGTATLVAATSGYQTFAAAGVVTGDVLDLVFIDGTAWEISWGVYSSTGPTVTRNLIASSTGSLLALSGSATVFISPHAANGPQIPVSSTAPTNPGDGSLWWSRDEGKLKIYYNDGSSSQWVDAFVATTAIGSSATGLVLAAGTASLAPLDFTAGTNLTTAVSGAMEYDGTVFYLTPFGTSRSVVNEEQLVVLGTAYTLTSQTGAQKLFNASTNGALTLAVGTYQFECMFSLSAMSATSGSFGFALGVGTAVIGSQAWNALALKAALATAAAPQSTFNTAANTTLATASTATVGYARIKGLIRVTTAGTIIPQVSLGVAAAAVVGANSYFKISPVSSINAAATNITVGNWS